MTLDEAIQHCEEVAEENEEDAQIWHNLTQDEPVDFCDRRVQAENSCVKRAAEHRQLTEWLKELKQLREQTKWIPVSSGNLPKEGSAVLVWCPERKNIYCAYLEEKQWWIFGAYFEKLKLEVTKWQPLPQLDKTGSGRENENKNL